jgi:hypothetical protein
MAEKAGVELKHTGAEQQNRTEAVRAARSHESGGTTYVAEGGDEQEGEVRPHSQVKLGTRVVEGVDEGLGRRGEEIRVCAHEGEKQTGYPLRAPTGKDDPVPSILPAPHIHTRNPNFRATPVLSPSPSSRSTAPTSHHHHRHHTLTDYLAHARV